MVTEQFAGLTEEYTGVYSPEPLKFAFPKKLSAHAGGGGRPLPAQEFDHHWLNLVSQKDTCRQKRAMYIHIPFCRTLCSYCRFFQNVTKPQAVQTYVDALISELNANANLPLTRQPFDALYFGGGTPTDLSARQITQIMKAVQRNYKFTKEAELTLEGRISEFDDAKLEAAIAGGITRFSLGVQSFDTKIRQALKRIDDGETVLYRLADMVRRYQSSTFVIDLMFGLPYQNSKNWQRDIAKFIDSGAHGVDLYQLIEMKGTGLDAAIRSGKLPTTMATPEKAELYKLGHYFFQQAGLRTLSCNHWATDYREQSIYNSMAKSGATIVPFGSGAGGNVHGVSIMQHRSMEDYLVDVRAGVKPIAMMMQSNSDAAWMDELKDGFDRGSVSVTPALLSNHQVERYYVLADTWVKHGLATKHTSRYELTLAGRFWNVTMCQAMIQWLKAGDAPVDMRRSA